MCHCGSRTFSQISRLSFLAVVSLIGSAESVRGDDAAPGPIAQVRHGVFPVLIRKEQNPLLRVIVDPGKVTDVRLKSLTISLEGTSDVEDIESLQVFATNNRTEFDNQIPFGERLAPQKTLQFVGDRILSRSKNVFWVTVRLKPTANLSDRVLVRCSTIDTSSGPITPVDETEPVPHRIGVAIRQHLEDGVHTSRIPSLATTPHGTLLCVFDLRRRTSRDLQEDIDIGLARSTDGGQTWEPTRVIMDMGTFNGLSQEQNGCSDPGILVDQQTGEVFCFALWMWGKPEKHQWVGDGSESGFEIGKTAQFLMVRSKDDGKTWSQPENLTRRLKQESWWLFAPSPQQGIQLSNGTLVMPVQGRRSREETFAALMISRDHGESWTVSKPAVLQSNECQAVLLSDGTIMLNARNDLDRFRTIYTTTDLGETWQPHSTNRKALIEPNCNGSLYRFDYSKSGLSQHILLFANPHTQKGRTHHTLQVSFDDGQTWPANHHLLLDEGRGAGYPSLSRVDDRHLGIVYEGSQSHIVFEKIPLDELLKPRVLATRAPGTTSLTNPNVACTELKEHAVKIDRGGVTVVVADNDAVDNSLLPGHLAGYNGLARFQRNEMPVNLFVPKYAGLNFEHIHDGTKAVDKNRFEPRTAPMTFRQVDAFTVELHQAATPNWQLESCGRYRVFDDGVVEYTFECIPRADTFRQRWIGLFWASYINFSQLMPSASEDDKAIHFPGVKVTAPSAAQNWIAAMSPKHGIDSTHPPLGFSRELRFDPDFTLTLAHHRSSFEYTESWYFGVCQKFAFVQMFRPHDQIWLAQSPSGGGQGNPAWDFQWFTESAVVNQPYGFVMRAAILPYSTREKLEQDLASHLVALGIRPPAK